MAQLFAISLPPSPRWWSLIDAIWSEGDAVLPIDHRLPESSQRERVESMGAAQWITPDGTERLANARELCDGDAVVILTSGSTGVPKGVVLTHNALTASAAIARRELDVHPNDAWYAALPFAFIGGFSVLYRARQWDLPLHFSSGGTIPPEATLTSLVPKQLHDLDTTIFRRILVGGASLGGSPPSNVTHTYGMSETAGGVVFDGIVPPEVTVILEGERILLDTPSRARAYRYADHDECLPEGPLFTNDAGRWRKDGRIEILGRLDDVIITGGEKVWPSIVEARLNACPGVTGSLVFGVPDDTWGQRVVAIVETTQGAESNQPLRAVPGLNPEAVPHSDSSPVPGLNPEVEPNLGPFVDLGSNLNIEAVSNSAPVLLPDPEPKPEPSIDPRVDLGSNLNIEGLRAHLRERLPACAIPKEIRLTTQLLRSPNGKILRQQP